MRVKVVSAVSVLLLMMMSQAAGGGKDDEEFDRLDGHGRSGKKVHVIEWEGNLEVHVYPKGSLAGLGMKLDKRNKSKPVMVLAYRFDNDVTKPVYRRAILGIDLREGFKAFKDESVEDYDKIIVSNHTLSEQVAAYRLDPEPKQLYPDGHPALADQQSPKPSGRLPARE